jgi:hypothetical protein
MNKEEDSEVKSETRKNQIVMKEILFQIRKKLAEQELRNSARYHNLLRTDQQIFAEGKAYRSRADPSGEVQSNNPLTAA